MNTDIYFYACNLGGKVIKEIIFNYDRRDKKDILMYQKKFANYVDDYDEAIVLVITDNKVDYIFGNPINRIGRDSSIFGTNIIEKFLNNCSDTFKMYILNNLDEFNGEKNE